ncbi:MAG: FAD-binding oxidoreductase [Deltaproteobacteria bacterium]|nr:FAD-binding oxidoreductase [Deltaproteobacteria bacterium]
MTRKYDYLILGAGIYGLYSAKLLGERGFSVAVVERDKGPFQRASYINQARVHHGYHYPRSISTARKTAKYYHRFNKDFSFAINRTFRKIYAISSVNSLTNAAQFKKFCDYVDIPAVEINTGLYFNKQYVESAFESEEYAFDPFIIRDWFMDRLSRLKGVDFFFDTCLDGAEKGGGVFSVRLSGGLVIETPSVINATYASVNQVLDKFGFEPMKIKYEICEVIIVDVEGFLKDVGLTVMDGQFFSIMPFGLMGKHSLTSVAFTPHLSSYGKLPEFPCQKVNRDCKPKELQNCNLCVARPATAYPYMRQLSMKFLREDAKIGYDSSLFAIKPILTAAELDDSRPTVIRKLSEKPSFISVLSGKINTVYDLDEAL